MTNRFPFPTFNLDDNEFPDASHIEEDREYRFTAKDAEPIAAFTGIPEYQSGPVEPSIVPKYNIMRGQDGNGQNNGRYVVELAVPGFAEYELSVSIVNEVLTISAKAPYRLQNDFVEYIYRGIPEGGFRRQFKLNGIVRVIEANYLDGILSIVLEKVSPENKARTVAINRNLASAGQLLRENRIH